MTFMCGFSYMCGSRKIVKVQIALVFGVTRNFQTTGRVVVVLSGMWNRGKLENYQLGLICLLSMVSNSSKDKYFQLSVLVQNLAFFSCQ